MAGQYVSEDAACRGLMAAVVLQAAEDYGNYLLGNYNKHLPKEREIYEGAKPFLLSDDLHWYTNIEGSSIVKEVERRVAEWNPKNGRFRLVNGTIE